MVQVATPNVEDQLKEIFFPYAVGQMKRLMESNGRFVHYTSAENAIKIINSRQVWMRSARSMNDYMEVEHGFEYLLDFFRGENNKNRIAFYKACDACHQGVAEQAIKRFDEYIDAIRYNTYLSCFSEHDDEEDTIGRLSMWRAYGRPSVGVAVVLKSAPFMLKSNALNIFSSPVSYLSRAKFHENLVGIIRRVDQESELLKSIDPVAILGSIFSMLLFAATCSKHPGFKEEREWRVIANPKIFPAERLVMEVETITGVPQLVLKVPLQDVPDQGLVGIEIPSFVDRIIIGPPDFPLPIFDAFVAALDAAGVKNPAAKVVISNIPLRV